jgi:hypothetical protein
MRATVCVQLAYHSNISQAAHQQTTAIFLIDDQQQWWREEISTTTATLYRNSLIDSEL